MNGINRRTHDLIHLSLIRDGQTDGVFSGNTQKTSYNSLGELNGTALRCACTHTPNKSEAGDCMV